MSLVWWFYCVFGVFAPAALVNGRRVFSFSAKLPVFVAFLFCFVFCLDLLWLLLFVRGTVTILILVPFCCCLFCSPCVLFIFTLKD